MKFKTAINTILFIRKFLLLTKVEYILDFVTIKLVGDNGLWNTLLKCLSRFTLASGHRKNE